MPHKIKRVVPPDAYNWGYAELGSAVGDRGSVRSLIRRWEQIMLGPDGFCVLRDTNIAVVVRAETDELGIFIKAMEFLKLYEEKLNEDPTLSAFQFADE